MLYQGFCLLDYSKEQSLIKISIILLFGCILSFISSRFFLNSIIYLIINAILLIFSDDFKNFPHFKRERERFRF